jgi:hypothetical protein
MWPPEKRNPAPLAGGNRAGFEVDWQAVGVLEINCNLVDFQAKRLQSRFNMSWPMAIVTAQLVYGRAPA